MKQSFLILAFITISVINTGFLSNGLSDKVRKGNELYQSGKLEEALIKYNDAQLQNPASPEVFFNMGNVFYRQKKYSEAADSYRKSMEKGNTKVEAKALYNIGNALFQQGQLREALDIYKQSLERDPNDVDTKYNIEYTEQKIKEMLSQAQQTMQKALQDQAHNQKNNKQQQSDAAQKKNEKDQSEQAAGAAGTKQEESQGNDQQSDSAEKKGQNQKIGEEKTQEQKIAQAGKPGESEDQGSKKAQDSQAQSNELRDKKDLTEEEAKDFLTAYDQSQDNSSPIQEETTRKGRLPYVEKDW